MKLFEIVGLKVVAVRGFRTDMRRKKRFEPQYILFDDGETYIELEEQDYHSFHDCSTIARELFVCQSGKRWKQIMEDEDHYPASDCEL